MDDNNVILVKGLSKSYKIGAVKSNGAAPPEEEESSSSSPVKEVADDDHGTKSNTIWALKDVSFDVKRGESVGIIGRNGAGKSTLLKILTGITAPTEGRAEIRGRVGSLLEVGTGFHPELTGRENVYLNGSILGMSRAEIRRNFDEIVSFAEVERFIDTPVKRYSSGMYVRLAFAVAVHLDPEILILDEVLAVGDLQFQKKCQAKMQKIGREGRTLLFVSHSMSSVSKICSKTLLLTDGRVTYWGKTADAIESYVQEIATPAPLATRANLRNVMRWDGNREKIITSVSLHRSDGTESYEFRTGDDIVIRVGYESKDEMPGYCQINVIDSLGDRIMVLLSSNVDPALRIAGEGFIECRIPDNHLLTEEYTVMLEVGKTRPEPYWVDCVPEAIKFRVKVGEYLGGVEWQSGQGYGTVAQKSEWAVTSSQ